MDKEDLRGLAVKLMGSAQAKLIINSRVDPVVFGIKVNGTQYNAIPENITIECPEDIPRIQDSLNSKAIGNDAVIAILETIIVDTSSLKHVTDDPIEFDSEVSMNCLLCAAFTSETTEINIIYYVFENNKYNFFNLGWNPKHTLLGQFSNPFLPVIKEI